MLWQEWGKSVLCHKPTGPENTEFKVHSLQRNEEKNQRAPPTPEALLSINRAVH